MNDAHLDLIENVRYAPTIFQDRISKIDDVRVTVMDREMYAVSCIPNHTEAALDWRRDPSGRYVPHELPSNIRTQILDFMKLAGLRFGAFDFCLTEAGEYVFLEVNEAGQFMFAEVHAGQPVSEAMARSLMRSSDVSDGK